MSQCIHCKKYIQGSYLDVAAHVMCCVDNPNYKLNKHFKDKNSERVVEVPFIEEVEEVPENTLETVIMKLVNGVKKAEETKNIVKVEKDPFMTELENLPEDAIEAAVLQLVKAKPEMAKNIRILLENIESFQVDERV